ncbi:hypothetical protein I4U23_011773 [Adineta vaga]|nr:hypothetical protein I4U23_011773 [Adineta vaga]
MSSSLIANLNFISQQITLYSGFIILILGVSGGCLTILVFLSLQTFRQSSCACHLLIMSIFNIGQLLGGVFIRILEFSPDIDWTSVSPFYCSWRQFFVQTCISISFTSFCFATIDQYWATCSRPKWRQWCNIKLALRLNLISIIICLLHSAPYIFLSDLLHIPNTKRISCIVINNIYRQYRDYVLIPVVNRVIPLTIIFTFGLLAHYNLQQIAYRTIPIVRRELDKQLTTMVLVQAVFTCLTITPYFIVYSIISYTNITNDPTSAAILSVLNGLMTMLYFLYFASPFYIYLCVSERFRRQFLHVINRIYRNQCTRTRIAENRVMPENY